MTEFRVTGGVVDLALPAKGDPPSEQGARAIEEALGSVLAYRPRALATYTFYEVLDQWLGPWPDGYPIAYGKFYNIKFSQSAPLQRNTSTRKWLESTTVCLQKALIELCARRFRAGTLGKMTEKELREVAFESHVSCYIGSGLPLVLMTDPYLIPLIALIPVEEFVPFTGNAAASWSQAIQSAVAAPAVAFGYGVALLMPAHSGIFARARRMDLQRQQDMMLFGQRLGRLKADIEAGRLDHLPWLDRAIRELERMELHDPRDLRYAREVLTAATTRRHDLIERYRRDAKTAPAEVKKGLEAMLPREVGSGR
jgi:hypothetical protein